MEPSVMAVSGNRTDGVSMIDSRNYYFGALAMTVMPLILGNNINSHLPSVGCQAGQSFDAGASARQHKVPERVPHHHLILNETSNFRGRAIEFIDALVAEYKFAHPEADNEAIHEFITEVTFGFFGTMASGLSHLRSNNFAGERPGLPKKMHVYPAKYVSKRSEIYSL